MNSRLGFDNPLAAAALCLTVAAITTMIHVKAVDLPNREFQLKWHQAVIERRAPAPDQYRVLTFAAAEGLRRLTGADLIEVYAGLRIALTAAALFVLYRYLRHWFSASLAATGVLLVGAALPVTFFGYRMQVSDPAQFLFFALAFRALQTDSPWWIYAIAPLAAANRETALFLIPFCVAAWWGTVPARRLLLRTTGLTLAMLAALAPIYLLFGRHEPYAPVFTLLANLSNPVRIIFPALLFGWLWIAAFADLGSKPVLLRRLLVPAALFIALHVMVAGFDEARLLLPLVPVILPLALFSMGDSQSDYVKQSAFSTTR